MNTFRTTYFSTGQGHFFEKNRIFSMERPLTQNENRQKAPGCSERSPWKIFRHTKKTLFITGMNKV
jgi:hypothetical protein